MGEDLLMVSFIGASSLRAALETPPNSQQRILLAISFAANGLRLNPQSIYPLLDLHYLLEKSKLKNKNDNIQWHDTIDNTITNHKLKNEAETVPHLIKPLSEHTRGYDAYIYCQRAGKRDIFDQLRLMNTLLLHAEKKIGNMQQRKADVVSEKP